LLSLCSLMEKCVFCEKQFTYNIRKRQFISEDGARRFKIDSKLPRSNESLLDILKKHFPVEFDLDQSSFSCQTCCSLIKQSESAFIAQRTMSPLLRKKLKRFPSSPISSGPSKRAKSPMVSHNYKDYILFRRHLMC